MQHFQAETYSQIESRCQELFQALQNNNIGEVIRILHDLIDAKVFPNDWLLQTARALEIEDFTILADQFEAATFFGPDGDFLIVAPYSRVDGDRFTCLLSALWGKRVCIEHPALQALDALNQQVFERRPQGNLVVHSFQKQLGHGHFIAEQGLPFIPANNWACSRGEGPVLNDLRAQQGRFVADVGQYVPQVFTPDTAELMLGLLDHLPRLQLLQQLEYQFHEAGHACGIGLTTKIQQGLLRNFWLGAVEDWRADGVELELMARRVCQGLLSPLEAGQVAAIYLAIRLGTDAFRSGGPDTDHDVNAAILVLDRLLESGGWRIDTDGRLGLKDPTYTGLLPTLEPHRAAAMALTRRELALTNPMGIAHLYGSVPLHPGSRELFHSLLWRCRAQKKRG